MVDFKVVRGSPARPQRKRWPSWPPRLRKTAASRPATPPGINDGAAAIVLASGDAVKKYNLKPLMKLVSWGQGGVDPKIMGTGPIPASRNALAKAGLKID